MRRPGKRWALAAVPVLAAALVAGVTLGDGDDNATADTSGITTTTIESGSSAVDPRFAEEGDDEAEVLQDLSLQPLPGIFDPSTVPQAPTPAYPGEVTGGSTVSTVEMPTGYTCMPGGDIEVPKIRVYPPSLGVSAGAQEIVTWGLAVVRWDGNAWQQWGAVRLDGVVAGPNGQSVNGWTAWNGSTLTASDGPFAITINTGSPGSYSVISQVVTSSSGTIQAGFLGGDGWSCTTP